MDLDPSKEIPSPCDGVCAIDGVGVCTTCLRTIPEITLWDQYSNAEKYELHLLLKERRNKA